MNAIARYLRKGSPDNPTTEQIRKTVLYNGIVLTGIVVMGVLGMFGVIRGVFSVVLADFSSVIFLTTILLLFHRSGSYKTLSRIGVSVIGFVFVYLLADGGDNESAFVWYYTFPLFATFLLGSIRGLVVSLVLMVLAAVVFLFDPLFPDWADYPASLEIRFMVAFIVVSLFSFLFQRLQEKSYAEIYKSADDLELAKNVAEQANQAKSEFLMSMSHELRTPLNHIRGFTELVQNEIAGPVNSRQKEYLGDVIDSSDHLLALINDILDMSKIEAGKFTLDIEPIDLTSFVRGALSMATETAADRGISLSAENNSNVARFKGDERKLRQVIYNLVSNAVKFTPDGGRVFVEVVDWDNKSLRFAVSDTGIGVEPANIERIFSPFEQEDKSASRPFQGTGIGLAISKRIVELHSGTI